MKDDSGKTLTWWALSREAVCDLDNTFNVIEEFTISILPRQVQMPESIVAPQSRVPQSLSIPEQGCGE
ncbi:hypothetical protein KTE54_15235 [Burkholderia multivorans]|uniref:hypothetical protein n=1 Tax=Burkholderia multivorans TaxID=87883 RepID=UPI001C26A3C5|nr:hypothetical protein [Burkholderia multivorans]MBU9562037.1 hypothetical protein [Burkholderia multivorans]